MVGGVLGISRTSEVAERGKIGWEREQSLMIKHFVYLLALLRESPIIRIFLDFSKAISFSAPGLPEVLFRILVLVLITTDRQILNVLVVDNEARLVSSVNSYSEFSNV